MTIQEYIEEYVPDMPLSDICEIEAEMEDRGFDTDHPDIDTLVSLIEDAGYTVGDRFVPEDDFSGEDDGAETDC